MPMTFPFSSATSCKPPPVAPGAPAAGDGVGCAPLAEGRRRSASLMRSFGFRASVQWMRSTSILGDASTARDTSTIRRSGAADCLVSRPHFCIVTRRFSVVVGSFGKRAVTRA